MDLQRRLAQHWRNPPRRMRSDAQGLRHITDAFEVTVLGSAATRALAHELETIWIARLGAQGPNGYNLLPADPAHSRAYWANRLRLQRAGRL